ncbi:MAG: AMP-binding protein [Planctomycetota bacterium]
MNLVTRLQQQTAQHGDQAAIVQGDGQAVTFSQLEERSGQTAAMFRDAGLGQGDRVVVLAPMSIDLYVVLIALWRLGASAMIVDPGGGLAHVRRGCKRLQPTGLVGVARAHALRAAVPSLRRVKRAWCIDRWLPMTGRYNAWRRYPHDPAITTLRPDTPALVTFTSGSTGEPKAAVRTHGFLMRQHEVLSRSIDLAPGQVDLATLAVFALANLASGVTTLIPDADLRRIGHIDPEPVWRQMQQHKPSRCTASPAFFERLLTLNRPMPWFEHVCTGGAPAFASLLDRLAHACPNARVTAVYGSTEAEPIAELCANSLGEAERRTIREGGGLPAGRPIDAISLRIVEDRSGDSLPQVSPVAFDAMTQPAGQAGEIVVSGLHVLRGYLDGQGDEQTKIHVGAEVWHRTGDAGRLDDQGRLWLLGRASAKVVDDRGVVYPLAVEAAADQALFEQDLGNENFVRTAFVLHHGRRTLVVQTTDPKPARLANRLREPLAWAGIERVLCAPRIPVDRRHNAKIDYLGLRRWLAKQR